MNGIIKLAVTIFALVFVLSAVRTCSNDRNRTVYTRERAQPEYNVTIQQNNVAGQEDAAAGLDLRAVADLIKTTQNAEELESKLNSAEQRINNLDLDEDGKVDFIKVTEYGDETMRGFSLTVDLAEGQTQEVATIEIAKASGTEETATIQAHGNPNVYGDNHYYHSRTSIGDVLLWSYLFSSMNRPMYNSGWGYGNYPGYYNRHDTISNDQYRRTVQPRVSSSGMSRASTPAIRSSTKSPNAGKTAANIKAPLAKPTTAQKSFQARNPSKTVRSGGFGRSKSPATAASSRSPATTRSAVSSSRSSTRTTPSRPSVRSSSVSRSRSSGGK